MFVFHRDQNEYTLVDRLYLSRLRLLVVSGKLLLVAKLVVSRWNVYFLLFRLLLFFLVRLVCFLLTPCRHPQQSGLWQRAWWTITNCDKHSTTNFHSKRLMCPRTTLLVGIVATLNLTLPPLATGTESCKLFVTMSVLVAIFADSCCFHSKLRVSQHFQVVWKDIKCKL